MKYVVHKRFKSKALCGEVLNLPYGTELAEKDGLLYYNNKAVCLNTSENGKMYFSRNDDDKGLERGKYTWEIAFSKKKADDPKYKDHGGFRFSEKQRDIIARHYQRFLRADCDMIIFNQRFFDAPVEELKEMADELGIRV